MVEGEPTGERKEPLTLEEQAKVYAEMFDMDSETILEAAEKLRAEMTEEERKELTMLIYAPEGMTTDDAWQMVKKENPTYPDINQTEITTQGETKKAVVAFSRYSQEPDEDSLGEGAKSAEDWEKTDAKFMSPKLRMIVGEFYRRAEGKQLDQVNATLSPGSRGRGVWVPYLVCGPSSGLVALDSYLPRDSDPLVGVRRVRQMEV